MRYYIDTNIWLDLLENREDNLRPLGEFAFQFIKHSLACKDIILYSDFVVEELKLKYNQQEIDKYCFEQIKNLNLMEKVVVLKVQIDEARRLSTERKVPKGDAIHAVLARDNDAVIVTRDKHFGELQDIAKSMKPEEVT